jgi:hypothetical protein
LDFLSDGRWLSAAFFCGVALVQQRLIATGLDCADSMRLAVEGFQASDMILSWLSIQIE